MPIPDCFDNYRFAILFEIREDDDPALFFFLKFALFIRGLSCFHTNFRIVCSSFVKNSIGILMKIEFNYVDHFG